MICKLIAYTQPTKWCGVDPAAVVEEAACVCYDSAPDMTSFKVAKACARSGHLSVWEHISFTFHIEGVSRSLLAQLTRHRHASYSVRSQRYCKEAGADFVNPFVDLYLSDKATFAYHEALVNYKGLLAEGAAPEDARSVLPNATATELVVTMNARALIEASHLRLCSRAQAEIRHMFEAMRTEVREVCPEVAELMRPSCETFDVPFCPELKSCGRHPKLKALLVPRDQWEDAATYE